MCSGLLEPNLSNCNAPEWMPDMLSKFLRKSVWLLILAILLVSPVHVCAQEREQPEMLPADDHAAWQAIGRLNRAGYRNKRMCSGTLVAPDRVLTAAHCVEGRGGAAIAAEELVFVAGWFRGAFVDHAKVATILPYPDDAPLPEGSWQKIGGDAVLLLLERPLTGVEPVPMDKLDPTAPFRILGYRWDRPHALSDSGTCPMLTSPPGTILMTCPVTFGTSGAPVLQRRGTGWRVVATVSAMSRDLTATIPVPPSWLAP